jgi:hypothetical protein
MQSEAAMALSFLSFLSLLAHVRGSGAVVVFFLFAEKAQLSDVASFFSFPAKVAKSFL